jgi:CheY-like chemotaxis protein
MFGLFSKHHEWPKITFEEIKKRARLLVIDDEDFIYKGLFEKDGYVIDKWDDITDLSKLEQNYFDLILLDVQGVGLKFSADQGLGILNHIRQRAPAQLVIAFSNADYSLKYQDFFKLADATLNKGADYVEFKRKVDELLERRFSLGFYVGRISAVIGGYVDDPEKLEKEARKAILHEKPNNIRKYLADKVSDPRSIEAAVAIIEVAIKVIAAWKS